MDDQSVSSKLNQFMAVFASLLKVPLWWIGLIVLAAIASMFKVSRADGGAFDVEFAANTITATFVGLIWLPPLIKVMSLTGGGLKTALGEANVGGAGELIWKIIGVLDSPESRGPAEQMEEVKSLITQSQLETAAQRDANQPDEKAIRSQLLRVAQRYELIRQTMPSGRARTREMGGLVAQTQSLALHLQDVPRVARSHFESGTDGGRLVGLALSRAKPHVSNFQIALDGIAGSRSAFEQYQALRAVEGLVDDLSPDQARQLSNTILDQQSAGDSKFITRDSDRYPIATRILQRLGSN